MGSTFIIPLFYSKYNYFMLKWSVIMGCFFANILVLLISLTFTKSQIVSLDNRLIKENDNLINDEKIIFSNDNENNLINDEKVIFFFYPI